MGKRVGMISLGCAKNQVNAEQMLYRLQQAGYTLQEDVDGADLVIVNTCGFIDSAKSEAIDNILAMGALKQEGRIGRLLVTGCLSQRYQDEILQEMPEVDGVLGTGSYDDIVSVADRLLNGGETVSEFGDIDAPADEAGRVLTTPQHYAYIKIAEGCNNFCAFCIIPHLRGRYRSRAVEDILQEARGLAESGVKELIVVAQDTSRYGTDLYGAPRLPLLLHELCRIEGFHWIRVHYLYPDMITDELLDTFASEPKLVNYMDIPIQHVNDAILRRMNRRGTRAELDEMLQKLRRRLPDAVIRTSLITGLPGEGEAEFEELCAWLRENKLERVGAFVFSPEDGTPAAKMEHADEEVAQRRAEIIAELQSRIMDEYDFVKMISQDETQVTDEVFLADYNVYLERIFICDPERTLFTCIMRDVTKARQRRNKIQKTKIHAADLADDIIANQLRIVHEIASLLGETAAETKVAVHDLKEAIMLDEDGDDDA